VISAVEVEKRDMEPVGFSLPISISQVHATRELEPKCIVQTILRRNFLIQEAVQPLRPFSRSKGLSRAIPPRTLSLDRSAAIFLSFAEQPTLE
jgi:hypothetical protein